MNAGERDLRLSLAERIQALRFASWDAATNDWESGYDMGLAKAWAIVMGSAADEASSPDA